MIVYVSFSDLFKHKSIFGDCTMEGCCSWLDSCLTPIHQIPLCENGFVTVAKSRQSFPLFSLPHWSLNRFGKQRWKFNQTCTAVQCVPVVFALLTARKPEYCDRLRFLNHLLTRPHLQLSALLPVLCIVLPFLPWTFSLSHSTSLCFVPFACFDYISPPVRKDSMFLFDSIWYRPKKKMYLHRTWSSAVLETLFISHRSLVYRAWDRANLPVVYLNWHIFFLCDISLSDQ